MAYLYDIIQSLNSRKIANFPNFTTLSCVYTNVTN